MSMTPYDQAIERAAIAINWARRPVLSAGPNINALSPEAWWTLQDDHHRETYRYEAREAIAAADSVMENPHAA